MDTPMRERRITWGGGEGGTLSIHVESTQCALGLSSCGCSPVGGRKGNFQQNEGNDCILESRLDGDGDDLKNASNYFTRTELPSPAK